MLALFNELQATFEGKNYLTEAGKVEFRKRLDSLASAMLELPQAELSLNHYFSKGIYTREMHAPKGTLILGRIHKYETVNTLVKGRILVLSEEGYKELSAPCTFVSGPNIQKLGYAIEDVIFLNSFATDKTDPEEALEEVTIDPKIHLTFYLKEGVA